MEKRRVGSYLLVRHLGTGGMASVYEAVHEPEGLRAAIKLLHPDYAKNPDVAARFLNEARAANSVDHPGIVRIYDSGILPDGVAYLSMEYVDGVSLLDRMQKLHGRMSQAHAVQLGQQLATSERARACFVRQALRFSRGYVEDVAADLCTLTQLQQRFAQSGYRITELLVALTTSPDFLYRK